MRIVIRVRGVLWMIAGTAVLGVALALLSQHAFGMQPCAWCVFQRLLFLVVAVLDCLAALASAGLRRAAAALAMLTGLGGIAAAIWQYTVAERSTGCGMSLADRVVGGLGLDVSLPWLFEARAMCADASRLFGLPYAWWSAALFAMMAAALAAVLIQRPRRN